MITEINSPLASQIAALQNALPKLASGDANFAGSLIKQYATKGSLSEKQIPFIAQLLGRAQGTAAPKPQTVAPGAYDAFLAAVPAGAAKPAVILALRGATDDEEDRRALRIVKVPGKTYLRVQYRADFKHGDWAYVGALRPDHSVTFSYEAKWLTGWAKDDALALLELFGEQMVDVLAKTGIFFGICANCGRTLTHPVSVKLGIGPVCVGLFPSLAKTYASAMALYSAAEKAGQ
jgi:hypothetical protein